MTGAVLVIAIVGGLSITIVPLLSFSCEGAVSASLICSSGTVVLTLLIVGAIPGVGGVNGTAADEVFSVEAAPFDGGSWEILELARVGDDIFEFLQLL